MGGGEWREGERVKARMREGKKERAHMDRLVAVLAVLFFAIEQSLPQFITAHVIERILDGGLEMCLDPSNLLVNDAPL